jgi:hypothetical protein
MDAWLDCLASSGQFTGEYAVKVCAQDGHWVSLFAPAEAVELLGEISHNQSVAARLGVQVIDQRGGLVLVRLPQRTMENGQHLTVSAEAIHQEA